MTLENLVGKSLMAEPTTPEEVQRLLRKAAIRLADAEAEAISAESRFDVAYEAVLQLAICALRANGYRPGSKGGHHVTALQGLSKSIDYPSGKIRLLDEFRRQRAIGLYDGSFEPTTTEVKALTAAGRELESHLCEWLRTHKSELLEAPDS